MRLQAAWHRRALRYLDSATLLVTDGDYESAVSRSYYAMFFAARAAVQAKGHAPRTHRGVVTLFAQHLVKTKRVEPDLLTALRDALDTRLLAEYDDDLSVSREQADALVQAARLFVERLARLLGEQG